MYYILKKTKTKQHYSLGMVTHRSRTTRSSVYPSGPGSVHNQIHCFYYFYMSHQLNLIQFDLNSAFKIKPCHKAALQTSRCRFRVRMNKIPNKVTVVKKHSLRRHEKETCRGTRVKTHEYKKHRWWGSMPFYFERSETKIPAKFGIRVCAESRDETRIQVLIW